MPSSAYVGIDYSGAETPTASLKGLRVYRTDGNAQPEEVPPPPSPRKYRTRRGIAEWLVEWLAELPTLVGIDHGFWCRCAISRSHGGKPDWPAFLDDFQRHWPTDEDIYVDFVRDGTIGNGAARMGNPRWRRLTEERAGGAKSVFHFDGQGSVAKSTHAGFPGCASFATVLAMAYISGLSTGGRSRPGTFRRRRNISGAHAPQLCPRGAQDDQHDAYSIAATSFRAPTGAAARGVPETRPDATRTHASAGGLDIGSGVTETQKTVN